MATRTYGLSGSGMDVDQMVKDLMKARRATYNTMWKKKTQAEWKKSEYSTMYTALRDFRTTVFNNRLRGNLIAKSASSSNSAVASATADSDAGNLAHTLEVSQLADGVRKASSAAITTGASKDTLQAQFGLGADPFDVVITNGTVTKTITVDPAKTINDFAAQINGAGLDIHASYDATLDRFFLATTNTGSAAGISFAGSSEAGTAFLTNNLKLDGIAATGKNALFKLDGVDLSQAANTFKISGVTYTLKSETAVGAPVTVQINSDIEKTVTAVKAFVESYNSVVAKVNAELGEEYYRDYLPLTDDEKGELKDDQVKSWEERARSGLLRRNPILSDLINQMRGNWSESVSGLTGNYTSAASIGVSTRMGAYSEGGKLYVDEDKLRSALTADPEAAYKIFGTDGTEASADGVATRLYATLKSSLDRIYSEAGSSASIALDSTSYLARQIRSYDSRLDAMEDRLTQIENRYYKQFDAMEQAISRMSTQSSWLSQQFSSG